MTTDARLPWELEYCLRLNFCKTFLYMMETTGIERQFIINVYGTNGDLDHWCLEHIQTIREKCDEMIAEHGPLSEAALAVTRSCGEQVMELYMMKGTSDERPTESYV